MSMRSVTGLAVRALLREGKEVFVGPNIVLAREEDVALVADTVGTWAVYDGNYETNTIPDDFWSSRSRVYYWRTHRDPYDRGRGGPGLPVSYFSICYEGKEINFSIVMERSKVGNALKEGKLTPYGIYRLSQWLETEKSYRNYMAKQ